MDITWAGIRSPRLTPLAGCLATALAFISGTADASRPVRVPSFSAVPVDRAQNGEPPYLPRVWKRPDPADIAIRWQPAWHELPEIPANAIVVQNCDDNGSGSLRAALANANSGDTIDLTQLSCSKITLTTGSILFDQTTMTLQGPGPKYLSIDGNGAYAPLLHGGDGTLYINDLTVEHGMKYNTNAQTAGARGGCIFSSGQVFLSGSVVANCTAKNSSSTYGALGGAVYGTVGVSLSNSSVVNSLVTAYSYALGGGIFSHGFVDITDSFVGGNYADTDGGGLYAQNGLSLKYSTVDGNGAGFYCGGLGARGNITISNSTISNNQATLGDGGANLVGVYATRPLAILNSTISNNYALFHAGAAVSEYSAQIANSTIAFNQEGATSKYGAGLYVYNASVDLESTIIGANTYAGGSSPDDLSGGSGGTITGANNLIGFSLIPTPGDTILLQSPMLGALAYNGGSTQTHMLLSGSPAIDAGNDLANVASDQRGTGFSRTIGAGTDIGAFELNTVDVIFANGFDP